MSAVALPDGAVLWNPPLDVRDQANLTRFEQAVGREFGASVADYDSLWRWTTDDIGRGWAAMWDFAGLPDRSAAPEPLVGSAMPGSSWFPHVPVNFAQLVLGHLGAGDYEIAILHRVEDDDAYREMTWGELRRAVAGTAAGLRTRGVGPGDRVVAMMPNVPEAMIAALATSAIGAIWSSCAMEFGREAVLERFSPLRPKVMFVAPGYLHAGRWYDRTAQIGDIQAGMPTLERTFVLDTGPGAPPMGGCESWSDLMTDETSVEYHPTEFEDPLWVLFTSGTTGRPKGIVHGHGGAVLGAVQGLMLHLDLKSDDRLSWHTSTGWVVWNILLSSLMFCRSIAIYDGSPGEVATGRLLSHAADGNVSMLGISGAYLSQLARGSTGLDRMLGSHELRGLCFTGSPINPRDYDWTVDGLPERTWFTSVTGGTDVGSTFFLAGSIAQPLRRGRFQCKGLGVAIESYDEAGRSLIDEPGELVLTKPVPGMPLRLWDDDGTRIRDTYFSAYDGVWRHGDLVVLHHDGGGTLLGRSDATLNRNGIRIGTSEIYSTLETIPGVDDALVVDLSEPSAPRVLLFVVLAEGYAESEVVSRISDELRQQRSPRHVPDEVHVAPAVPRTLNGKRVEVPIKRMLSGDSASQALNEASIGNPDAVEWFIQFANAMTDSND